MLGTGRPLVLLHGALTTINGSFGRMLPSLAATRQVIAVEQQAHGRTADIDRPLTYEGMGKGTAELLRHLGIENADIFGYSMGAVIEGPVDRPWNTRDVAVRDPDGYRLVFTTSDFARMRDFEATMRGVREDLDSRE